VNIPKNWEAEYILREQECAKTLKGRALLCIDEIITNLDPYDDPLLDKIGRIAHCATGVCSNPHEDWVKEVNETYRKQNLELIEQAPVQPELL